MGGQGEILPPKSCGAAGAEGPATSPAAVVVGNGFLGVKGEAGLEFVIVSGEWTASRGAVGRRGHVGSWEQALACIHGMQGYCSAFRDKNEQIPTPVVKNIHLYLHTRRTIQQNTHTNGWMVLGILFLTKSNLWGFFSPCNHQVIGTNVHWVRLKIDEELLALGSKQGENGK